MKLKHMRSREGRRGHKWFPESWRTDRRMGAMQAGLLSAAVATILALSRGRR
jgi:hypothetical protein